MDHSDSIHLVSEAPAGVILTNEIIQERNSDTSNLPGTPTLYRVPRAPYGIKKVVLSDQVAGVLSTDGQVFTWGNGLCGHGSETERITLPQVVQILSSTPISDIACGKSSFVCVCSEGGLYSWPFV